MGPTQRGLPCPGVSGVGASVARPVRVWRAWPAHWSVEIRRHPFYLVQVGTVALAPELKWTRPPLLLLFLSS